MHGGAGMHESIVVIIPVILNRRGAIKYGSFGVGWVISQCFGTMDSGQAPDWPVDGSSDAWWGAYAFYLHNTLFGDVVQWSLCTWLEEWGGGCTSPYSSSRLPPPHLSPPPPPGRTPDLNIIRPDVNSPVLIAPLWRPGRSHKFIPNEASPERNQATWTPSGHHDVKDVG